MNGVHDLGGMDGLRLPERDQGFALHEEWERLTWGMLLATFGTPGLPAGNRRFIESLPPARYLTMPYYARFLESRTKSFLDTGLVTQERQATTLICRASYPAMRNLLGFLADECCADATATETAAA